MVVSDVPFVHRASHLSPRYFGLGQGRVGLLDGKGTRVLATPDTLRRIEGPPNIENICVAADHRVTFAQTRTPLPDGQVELFRADDFDGQLISVGRPLTMPIQHDDKAFWIVRADSRTLLVDCASGSTETIPGVADRADQLFHNDQVRLFRLSSGKQTRCVSQTLPAGPLTELPACQIGVRQDRSVQVETLLPPDWMNRKLRARCLFVLAASGKQQPCGTAVGPWASAPPVLEPPQLSKARYYAPNRAVVASAEGRLFRLEGAGLEPRNRLSPDSLTACTPVAVSSALFACTLDARFDVMVRVEPDGHFEEELRRPKLSARGFRIPTTADGGVAVAGDCAGKLEQGACVRDRRGHWHTVRFSSELQRALTRTAPSTKLIPNRAGELYVGIGTLEGDSLADVRLELFRADAGPATRVERLPSWILASLAELGDTEAYLLGDAAGDGKGPSFSWSRADRIRLWPFTRSDPAFGSRENCGVDVGLDGKFVTTCTQGTVSAVGRLGLLQKGPGEIYETLDAGSSWRRLDLPTGFDGSVFGCSPIGCDLGPYYRLGWGP